MGKGVLIVALGVVAIVSVLMMNLNANTNRNLDTTLEFYKTTQSRLIANSGIEIYLEKLRRDKSLKGTFLGNDLLGGSYDIYISGDDSLLTIKSVGKFDNYTHSCLVTATREPILIPKINAAVYVSADNLGLNLNGNIDINGNDHYMNGTLSSNPPLPGIAVDQPADSAYIINDIKPKISSAIQGSGGSPSVRSIPDTTDWLKLTENYIFASDITLPSGTYTTGTVLGTASEPKITYANGNVNFSGQAYGYGIMIVNGNLSLSGNFYFKGIVIAYGQSTIETKTVGNSGIYGASIFVGKDVDIQATGNAELYYSKESIDNAKNNLKSSQFKILSWWE